MNARSRRKRGYALPMVLLVSVVISGILATLFVRLNASTRLAAQQNGLRRSRYICDGVATLASRIIREALPTTPVLSALDAKLDPLRLGVAQDRILIDALRADTGADSRRTTVPSGAFAGLNVIAVDVQINIALRGEGVPPCTSRETLPLASLSVFQLPAFSTTNLSVAAKSAFVVEPAVAGIAWGASGSTVSLAAPPPRPAPPPPTLRAETAVTGPLDLAAAGRALLLPGQPLFEEAGLRIVDGEWSAGRVLYSDHVCANDFRGEGCSSTVAPSSPAWRSSTAAVRRLYSRYERNGLGFVDGVAAGVGAGVVSYGSLVGVDPAGFLSAATCSTRLSGAAVAPGTFAPPASCARFAAGDRPELVGKGGRQAALLDVARGGFGDPQLQGLLPMNIDVEMLGAAMLQNRNGEVGTAVCLPGAVGGCTAAKRFNGILYLSAGRGSLPTAPAGALVFPASDARNQGRVPWPLCGDLPNNHASVESGEQPGLFTANEFVGCDDADYARVTAIRLVRAGDLRAFKDTGLTIVSDLPVFVQGSFNTTEPTNQRTAIIAERVTFLSSSWNDELSPFMTPAPPPAAGSPVVIRTSLLTGAANVDGAIEDVVRAIEPNLRVTVIGSLGIAFPSTVPAARTPQLLWRTVPELLSPAEDEQPPGAPRATFLLPTTSR